MRVPPHLRTAVVWAIRFALLLALVALALFAILSPEPVSQVTAVIRPVSAAAPPTVPAPSVTARPTQTAQPITSIILRGTESPYPTSTPSPANQPTVSIVDYSYMPGVIRINAGETVLWRNDGSDEHDVTGSDWHSGQLDPTYTYYLTFGVPGTYNYRCSIHLDMTGSVIVS